MKLSNAQIEALASEIRTRYNNAQEKIRNEALRDVKNISQAKKYKALLNKIPEAIRNKSYCNPTERKLLESIVDNKITQRSRFDFHACKDKILLASIERKTLSELRNKIG